MCQVQVHVHLQKYRVLVLMTSTSTCTFTKVQSIGTKTSTSTCTCLSTNMNTSTFIDEGKYMSEQEQVYSYSMCQKIPFAKSVACQTCQMELCYKSNYYTYFIYKALKIGLKF